MTNMLREHFPIIRDRENVLEEIQSRKELSETFYKWKEKYQNEFLDFCTGVRGVKLLYDSFFKIIMNPDATPERLEEVLSLILERKIKILKVLPNESIEIAAENSLLILDIVVELEDGSVADIEVQKIGYAFPGQRSACYSADLLLRQYKRVKSERGNKFSYRDIKKVYTIILFERSTREFHNYPDTYIHRMKQKSDTGINLDMLQEFVFVSLDIFLEKLHNKGIDMENKLEAWLTFLGVDEPELIMKLLKVYPEFDVLYQEVYELCRDTEEVMRMFSKELAELDRNTVRYMIDEMQDTIEEQQDMIEEQQDTIEEQQDTIEEQQDTIKVQQDTIDEQKRQLVDKEKEIEVLRKLLEHEKGR